MDSFDVNIGQHFLRLGELTALNPYNKEDCPGLRLTTTEARFKRPELFIDSILNFVPTQHFYIDGGIRQWILLDGNKRLNAVKDFLDNKFPFFDDVAVLNAKGYILKMLKRNFY